MSDKNFWDDTGTVEALGNLGVSFLESREYRGMLGIVEFWTKKGKDNNKVSDNTETSRSDRGDNRVKVWDISEVEDIEMSINGAYLEGV